MLKLKALNNVMLNGYSQWVKGLFNVAKNNIIWCDAMCLCDLRLKTTHYSRHTVHYCCSVFLKCIDCYKAHRSEKRGVL